MIEDQGFPERLACRLIGVDRTAFHYQRSRNGDATVRTRMRELASERSRFGYRGLAIMLKYNMHTAIVIPHTSCAWPVGLGAAYSDVDRFRLDRVSAWA